MWKPPPMKVKDHDLSAVLILDKRHHATATRDELEVTGLSGQRKPVTGQSLIKLTHATQSTGSSIRRSVSEPN
jgi:hypothetical protein